MTEKTEKRCIPSPSKCWRCSKFNSWMNNYKFDKCKELTEEQKKKIKKS